MEVLIVGGTGFIGQALQKALDLSGIAYKILSRRRTKTNHVYWDPAIKQLDVSTLGSITHIINLAGAGIADQRWSKRRKEELISSRVDSTHFLYEECSKHCPSLEGYIGISGVTHFANFYNSSYAPINAKNLISEVSVPHNNHTGDIIVNVSERLSYQIFDDGDIIVYGAPKIIQKWADEGNGEIIQKN